MGISIGIGVTSILPGIGCREPKKCDGIAGMTVFSASEDLEVRAYNDVHIEANRLQRGKSPVFD